MVPIPSNSVDAVRWTITAQSEDETVDVAGKLAPLFKAGDLITLSGGLGAGKTSLARALIRALTKQPALDVPSPTFTLVQTYDGPEFPIVHADLYRISDPEELVELGFDDLIHGALALIEWPERAPDFLRSSHLDIAIKMLPETGGAGRSITLTGTGPFAATLAQFSAQSTLLANAGWANASREKIAGDASGRHFERLKQGDQSAILMISPLPDQGLATPARNAYRAAAKLSDSVGTFIAMADGLRSIGLSAPKIFGADIGSGLVLAEDFGTEGIVGSNGPIPERYFEATALLAKLHSLELPRDLPQHDADPYHLPAYDIEALLVEVEVFLEWFMPKAAQKAVSMAERDEFLAIWRRLLEPRLLEQHTWTLRDYHSPNLFWIEGREGIQRVGVIDIQDAVWGHPAYDLGSLLQDARVAIPESLELELFEFYIRNRHTRDLNFDMTSFVSSYAIYAAQRVIKVLGIFNRLNQRDAKPEYLRHLPHVKAYLRRDLRHSALGELREWLHRHCPELLGEPLSA